MPPLHTVEAQAGVTNQASTQPSTASVAGGTVDSSQTNENDNTNNINNNNNSNSNTSSNNSNQTTNNNNTISAAADSSDNQPSTPQPTETMQQQHTNQNSSGPPNHHPYSSHHIYQASQNGSQMYNQHIYSSAGLDNQQHNYPSYLNSYEQFYQQQQHNSLQSATLNAQQQHPQMNFSSNSLYLQADYKQQQQQDSVVRYHPYLHNPTSVLNSQNSQNSMDNTTNNNTQTAPAVTSASSGSLMSPRVVSSTSPSSSSNQMPITGGSTSSIGSPNTCTPQCKKCGIMCTNDTELQEHIGNVHGASPYDSSGYASSPYIKEELQQQTPPSQQQSSAQQPNTGDLLDLDAQKMLYPSSSAINMSNNMMQQQPLGPVSANPLHGLHNMQQRAGLNTWDQQQTQEGLPPYLQQQQPPQSGTFQSSKESQYHVSNSSNIMKTDYALIKSEYPGADTQQSITYVTDKSFDPTAPGSQQQMMPPAVPSSPAEFPSTTTGGPQDNGQSRQKFRSTNFEPPSSSSTALTTEPLSGKAANWKSNEARRPKTYNCTACNKWFTSSGHLKRHYNTTLHKNAVKSSGLPDPATLPISAHHHPSRDPNAKSGRRGAAAAAAAAAANNTQGGGAKQQQQPPNPVQPPEPPNSPQDYGSGPQMAGGSLPPMSHYSATPSPNNMYQQQQQTLYQHHQYMPQMQTTNASNHFLQQQQTVINGHPNALAGLSVQTRQVQQQMPMPSSQMRGLLNNTMSTPIPSTIHTIKNEHMEAAILAETPPELQMPNHIMATPVLHQKAEEEEGETVQEFVYLTSRQMKPEASETLATSPPIMYTLKEESVDQLEEQQHLPQQVVLLREVDHNAEPHHTTLLTSQQQQFQAQEHQQQELERLYHSSTPSSIHSPIIISHQQYQEQLQHQPHQQMVAPDTYTPPPQLHNIMEHQQPYINMPLAINTTQQLNNMLQLQPPDTIIPTPTSMDNMPAASHHMQQPQQQLLTELRPLHNTPLLPQQQLDTINTSTPHMHQPSLTTSSITNMQSYPQTQLPASVQPHLDHTLTYPPTIIGNAEVLTLDEYGNIISSSGQHQQVIQTTDGQLVQFISSPDSTGATTLYTAQTYKPYSGQGSPQEADLPPMTDQNFYQEHTTTLTVMSPPQMGYRTSLCEDFFNSNHNNRNCKSEPPFTTLMIGSKTGLQQIRLSDPNTRTDIINTSKITTTTTTKISSSKRKRDLSTSSSVSPNSTIMPSGRIKCIPCEKEFTKSCYLTQHNNSFHSGEYPYRCEFCGKRFQNEESFQKHQTKHKSVEKDHKCLVCPKQFHHKTDLRRHVDAIHTNNKQHTCDVCQKSFCRKDHLRKHLETHNKIRVVGGRKTPATSRPRKNAKANKKTNDSMESPLTQQVAQDICALPTSPTTFISNHATTLKPAMQFNANNMTTTNIAMQQHNLNQTNSSMSSTSTGSSPTMTMHIEDDERLENGPNENSAKTREEHKFFSVKEYEDHIKLQQQQELQQKLHMQ